MKLTGDNPAVRRWLLIAVPLALGLWLLALAVLVGLV